ncbi:DUF4206 domain containing protein-like protein [Dinothrombium tinctorium]|uniref:DUF4206 domain containing protein-like protein n=1 Tax=Dinothrombium tinctorium TaxID=1965070 RepID=A0A3S3P425_9ACAR|nr:DUF4206 domain containing protein-like protein [Dinothrombium tinctorium]RWS11660.1 DUF4206 domain containing protein-like protein [Dinothrombium tinctorium]RWS17897.1 DUF4206 domain containing protein-like protein [Dinothrombium tinctorium]
MASHDGDSIEENDSRDDLSFNGFEVNEFYFSSNLEDEEIPNNKVQLEEAISKYMKLIRVQNSDEEIKKRWIKRLCDLRVKLNELNENSEQCIIFGHRFKRDDENDNLCLVCLRKPRYLPPLLRNTLHQNIFSCGFCEFSAHQKCLKQTKSLFPCPKELFAEEEEKVCDNEINPLVILKICPENGLSAQEFKCFDCSFDIDINNSLKCDYNGKYYCQKCHLNNLAIIPARVIHNWDFEPRPVSNKSLCLLNYIKIKPVLFNILKLNSMLYGLVEELCIIKRVRQELCLMAKYVRICKQPSKPKLSIVNDYLLDEERINSYSLNDLSSIKDLQKKLLNMHHTLLLHITKDCESCKGKGFYCELCRDRSDLLFPFSSNIANCHKCKAVYHNHQFVDIINLLIVQRANVNSVSNYGHTPLHLAAQQSSLEVIDSLVKGGAKLNRKDCEGRTPLCLSCLCNQTEVAKYLISQGSDVNLTDNCLNSPLLLAVNSGLCLNPELVKALLNANADPNHVNVYGQTALMTAIRRASDHCLQGVETVNCLIRHNCDLDVIDPASCGESPLHLSISRSQDRITETLIRSGCDLNRKNPRGFSPLYRLIREGKTDLAKLILAAGVDYKSIYECSLNNDLIESLQDAQLKDMFLDEEYMFPKLKHLSRIKIRRLLGRRSDEIIKRLPLPSPLKHYLLLLEL